MNKQSMLARPMMQRMSQNDSLFARALDAVALAAAEPARRQDARQALASVKGRSASELGLWYALAGSNNEALVSVRRAYDSGADVNLPFMLLHPAFDAIRSQEDYQSILSELHMVAS
ncbi:MAG: hypothetical protein ACT4O1_13240 [Gemmatimonadota bacterium]